MECTCSHIMLGSERTEHKNWNPGCEEHGWESEWYNSPEQTKKRLAEYERSSILQRIARERRNNMITAEEARSQVNDLDRRTLE